MPTADEIAFHRAMAKIYADAKKLGYDATRFKQMLGEAGGGVETAHRLLAGALPSEGFEALRGLGRLDLTVEAHVLRPEFRHLFTTDEQAICQHRLDACGYTGPSA